MSKMILSITLLLLLCVCRDSAADRRHPSKNRQCCGKVSSHNISRRIQGTTYQIQLRNGKCVHAIIFRTNKGRVCVDPNVVWVKKQIANMTRVKKV